MIIFSAFISANLATSTVEIRSLIEFLEAHIIKNERRIIMELEAKKMNQLMMEMFTNAELKNDFISNPKVILQEKGIDIPESTKIKVLEETENTKYIILPYLKPGETLSIEELERKSSKSIHIL